MNSRLYQILLQTPERAPNGIHNEFDIPTKLVQLWKETTNCSRSWRTSPSHQFFNLKLKKILLVTELSHINVERRNLEILTNFIYLRTSFYKKMLTLNSKVEPLSEGRRFEPISIFNWEIKAKVVVFRRADEINVSEKVWKLFGKYSFDINLETICRS